MTSSKLLGTVATLAIALGLAACAGGASTPPASSSAVLPAGGPIVNVKCAKDHGVYLSPCSVTLTVTNPSATVTAHGPTGDTFTVTDKKCTNKMIATVEGAGSTYDVAAGTAKGSCTAKFTDKNAKGNTVGTAVLQIKNEV